MSQTLAIFHEAYRNLNAKKMFWIVLLISALVVVAFALIGINEKGLKIAFWQIDTKVISTDTITPALFYKWIFVNIGIGFWLAWLAAILALVSTAGIFPDLITSGSVDLLISRPISRLRLFITEYAAGLLFVTLQITIFSLASFLIIGLRGGVWEPGLFIAVPLVVCMFSYLFSVCVFFGIVTRSTVAALLLTLLFWFVIYGIGASEHSLLMFQEMDIESMQKMNAPDQPPQAPPETKPQTPPPPDAAQPEEAEQKDKDSSDSLEAAHKIIYAIKTVLPKTTETIALLERTLISMAELPDTTFGAPNEQKKAAMKIVETIRKRSVVWVVGTSLGFEFFVLAWAAFIFCRRDY